MNELQRSEKFTLEPTNFNEAERLAKYIAMSDFAPKDYKGKTANVLLAVQMGAEMGLKPMQSIQNIAVINGRPCVWGDAMLAIVKAQSDCEYVDESFDDKTMTATCKVKRKNQPICERSFSMREASDAQLSNKMVWKQYPKRMLQMRARAFALRDSFPDAIKGLNSAEEVRDYNTGNINSKTTEHTSVVYVRKEDDKVDEKTGEVLIEGKVISEVSPEELEPKINKATQKIEEDQESQKKPRNRKINAAEINQIEALFETRVVDVPIFYSYFSIEQLIDLTLTDFDKAIKKLQSKPYSDIPDNLGG